MTAPARALPGFIPPMAAQVVDTLPEGGQWMYEVKFDGYRALLLKNGSRVRILSRNNKDLTAAYAGIRAAGTRLRAGTAVVDGEIVALDQRGVPSFQALQHRSCHRTHTIQFYAFDLLHLDGRSLVRLPLEQRRARLSEVIADSGLLLSEELHGTAGSVVAAVRSLGLEGIVAKRRDSRYEAGRRSGAWRKLKLERRQEFVIGGYRPGPNGVDALLVGVYDGTNLRFAGKVRAGFTPHTRRDLFALLDPLHAKECPFEDLPDSRRSHWGGGVTAEEMREMEWVRPKLVAQIRFIEWTAEGRLRHAAFLGMRKDKNPRTVHRE